MLLNIKEAACAVNGEYRGSGNITVTGMFTDSREAFEGGIFFALKGERVDGHSFVNELNAKGYPCVVSEEEYLENVNKAISFLDGNYKPVLKELKEKMEEAKRLLRYSDKPMTAISSYLGFSSPGHFAGAFKKVVGIAPRLP